MNQLKIYPIAPEEPKSQMYTVRVNGLETGVYTSFRFDPKQASERIQGRPVSPVSFTAFDFEGEAEIEIRLKRLPTHKVMVRPLSLGIHPETDGTVIRLKITQNANFSVEPFGEQEPLHIFANPMETDIPDKTAPNVHYFEAGTHRIDPFRLKDNDIVYLEGGAFVYAKPQPPEKRKPFGLVNAIEMWWTDFTLMAEGVKNVRIAGRGVLCGRKTLEACQRHRLLGIMRSTDVTVEGIVFREGTSWSIHTEEASQVLIDNVKVLGHFANNDGIDVCDSHDVLVRNSFAHNADDSFLVKAFKPVSNVVFENCVAWNDVSTSFGAVCEIAAEAKNIVFRSCTVTHSTFPLWDHDAGGVIGVWNAYGGTAENFLFEDITIEKAAAGKEPIKVSAVWLDSGRVRNVTFRNIDVLDSGDERIAVYGQQEKMVDRVHFENICINGRYLRDPADPRIVNSCNADITVQ